MREVWAALAQTLGRDHAFDQFREALAGRPFAIGIVHNAPLGDLATAAEVLAGVAACRVSWDHFACCREEVTPRSNTRDDE